MSSHHVPKSGAEAIEEAVIQVFKVFMTIPNAQQLLTQQQPLPADFFLKNTVVAKELFSHEPGCAVNYQALKEKMKILEPHFKMTSSGRALMAYFAELHKLRHMWAFAFAQYESHTIMSFMFEQTLYGRHLNAAERSALNPQGPHTIFGDGLKAVVKQLQDFKGSREFAQYVHILEECVKKYRTHVQRKAQAEKARQALMKKKKAEARKATKAAAAAASSASASPAVTQQNVCVQPAFNPDLPDFAQFVHSYVTHTHAAAAGVGSQDLGPAQHQPSNASLLDPNLATQPIPAAAGVGSQDLGPAQYQPSNTSLLDPNLATQPIPAAAAPSAGTPSAGSAGAPAEPHVVSNAATPSVITTTTNADLDNGTVHSEYALPALPTALEEFGDDWQYRDGDLSIPSLFDDEDEQFFRELFGV